MQSRDARSCHPAQQREVQVIRVKVYDVELPGLAANQFHQPDVVWQRLPAIRIAPKGTLTSRRQGCAGLGIATGEQGDIMAELNQFFGEPGNNSFRSAIEFRRHAFVEWRYLCDSHGD
jgi:hypothetical protein